MNGELNIMINEKVYKELRSIRKLIYLQENFRIDIYELNELITNFCKTTSLSHIDCLIIFRIDIFKGKKYQDTFNKFLYNK
jgi:hypothetical protein